MSESISKEKVLDALRNVQDPELKRDIVTLGMVRECQLNGAEVNLHLELTTGAVAVRQAIEEQVNKVVSELAGVSKLNLKLSQTQKTAPFAKQSIPGIKHVIAVASGKGGVGKTTVSVNLSLALAAQGHKVGLMDGDIYGPNVPLMLGIDAAQRPLVGQDDKMIPLEAHGISMISMGVLVPPDQPMIWRGPMLHGAVTQFLQKVNWGELDYLIVDLPPGTGDVQLSLAQSTQITGAVIVTTPQEVALMDVRKGVAMFKKTSVPILGVIENMTGEVFGKGGGQEAARIFNVPFLGEIPLDKSVREGGDQGKPVVMDTQSALAKHFLNAAEKLSQALLAKA